MIKINFLGTSSMTPTKERNQSSFLLRYNSDGILFDCGEGTQRQLKLAGIPITRVTKILLTHWHGDHTLGLPGMIQSLGSSEYSKTLSIFGPKGTSERLKHIFKAFVFDIRIKLNVQEIESGKIYENEEFILFATKLKHGIITYGYSFIEKDRWRIDMKRAEKFGLKQGPILGSLQRGGAVIFNNRKILPEDVTYVVKGKKITYITDTVLCNQCYELAENSDVLVCEATYDSKLEKKSSVHKHMTAMQSAQIAKKSNSKKLILTHISARYKNKDELLADAKKIFDEVILAYDFLEVKI